MNFESGQKCWKYRGTASIFSETFAAGQKLVVTSTGELRYLDGKYEYTVTQPREISVGRHGDSNTFDVDDDTEFVIPKSGEYEFSIWPHEMQGYPGTFIVCKL